MPLDIAPEPAALADQLIPLSRVGIGQSVIVRKVRTGTSDLESGDIGLRLLELGFVEGESLRVIAHGFPGNEPIAVRIGNTTFALRRFEAEHVLVKTEQSGSKT
jgi:ferrous iron transport protein A